MPGLRIHLLTTLGLPLTLAACGPAGVELELQRYQAQVEDLLGVRAVAVSEVTAPQALPRRRLRALPVEQPRGLSLWQFLQIQDCRLGELAGYRNSQLGRVMAPPRRLAYELEVLDAVEQCRGGMEGELSDRVEAAARLKRAQLPSVVWNAVWLSREIEGLLRLAGPPGPLLDAQATALAIDGLSDLIERADARSWPGAWAPVFQGLARHRGAVGQLLRRLDAQRRHLDLTAAALEAARDHGVCQTLDGVREAYVRGISARIEALRSDARQVLEATGRLYRITAEPLDAVPAAMREYARTHLDTALEESIFEAHQRARRRHSAAWVAAGCALTRGAT